MAGVKRTHSNRSRNGFALRGAALSAVLGMVTETSTSLAQCRVVPGPDGELSVWNVTTWAAGPTPRRDISSGLSSLIDSVPRRGTDWPSLHPATAPLLGWRARASSHASIDLTPNSHRGGVRAGVATLHLDVRTAGDRWLFVGTTDSVSVRLDGVELSRSTRPRRARPDDDVTRLTLSPGAHTLTLAVLSRGDLRLFARLTGPDFRPDPNITLTLESTQPTDCDRLFADSVSLDVSRSPSPDGTVVRLTASFPGGSVATSSPPAVTVSSSGTALSSSPVTFGASMPAITVNAISRASRITVSAGQATRDVRIAIPTSVSTALLRAATVLRRFDPLFASPPSALPYPSPTLPAAIPLGSFWSVEGVAERLARLVSDADPDTSHLEEEASHLASLVDDLEASRDPYAHRTGPLRRAYRSPLDGTLQLYSVYVPPAYRRERRYPLIVGLHGLNGSAHRMLPVLVGLYDESEDRTRASRHLPAMPTGLTAILAAPYGYGNSGYRQQGEYDVLRVTQEVSSAYATDPDRTYLTGLSMGGIGAAGVALHNPDVFAAMAPLCGYHSYFIRGDTRGPRRPWELAQMELRSNDHWAENGLHLPMYLVHGTLDRPTANSQVLVDRYQSLGYTREVEWPELGHNVWGQTYADGRIVPYFARFQRNVTPRRVRFRSPDLHWSSAWWVTLDALETRDARLSTAGLWGEVDVAFTANGSARGSTHNLGALTLSPPRSFTPGARWSLTLDGDTLELPSGEASSLHRNNSHWVVGPRVVARSGRGLRDLYDTPLIFVVGTGSTGSTGVANLYERVARAWAHHPGVPTRYPIVRDDSFTAAMAAGRTVVLVGTPDDNRVLASLASRLPIRITHDGVTVGRRHITGPDLGAVFNAPHPDHGETQVMVISGTTPVAVLRSVSLPELLPQYVVFDQRVAAARGRVTLGPAATVLAAGYLDTTGQPLGPDLDPVHQDPLLDAATP